MDNILKFGKQENGITYIKRRAVYAVIINDEKDKLFVVKTNKGHYFLPGGGIEKDELELAALKRELLEETGYTIKIVGKIGRAQNYFFSTKNEPIMNDALFYKAQLVSKVQLPIENDHHAEWILLSKLNEFLFHEHHRWACKEAIS